MANRLEKLSSYTRTLRVPGDYPTPAEALAVARDRDRIVLGAATWKGPLVVNAAVELQGAGFNETRVECAPEDGSAITIGPDAKGARISGIAFRHESFAAGADRYSVGLVRGGNAVFVDCRFTDGSGHGLAIIEGGQASVSRSRFADNGWNGVTAFGKGSTLEVRDCESLNNFEHGIE
ncbi:MAG: right-handed parallel beta-helix repeat-containing protein, partial [Verrucomicrobiaceae bacterium]